MSLFLAPHNDDETLFGTYTILREKPLVLVILRSFVQENRGLGITYHHRETETDQAMSVLGVPWAQWDFSDEYPDWPGISERLSYVDPNGSVFAPAFEEGGHPHHNMVAELADRIFGVDQVTHYLTYKHDSPTRTRGTPVPIEPGWPITKAKALACYRSQLDEPSTKSHFQDTLDEFYE